MSKVYGQGIGKAQCRGRCRPRFEIQTPAEGAGTGVPRPVGLALDFTAVGMFQGYGRFGPGGGCVGCVGCTGRTGTALTPLPMFIV